MTFKSNTIDVEVNVYTEPHDCSFRYVARNSPDFPGIVEIAYQEETSNQKDYLDISVINLDKETWDKLKYAVEIVFEKSI